MKHKSIALFAAGAIAVFGLLLVPKSGVGEVNAAFDRTAQVVRDSNAADHSELRRLLAELVTEDAVVRVAELPPIAGGPDAVAKALAALREGGHRIDLTFSETHVLLGDDGRRARAQVDFVLTRSKPPQIIEHRRGATVELERGDSGWRIAAVDVAPQDNSQPEARP